MAVVASIFDVASLFVPLMNSSPKATAAAVVICLWHALLAYRVLQNDGPAADEVNYKLNDVLYCMELGSSIF